MKPKITNIWILMIISLCQILLFSRESIAFRCGKGLVSTGDTKAKVLIECGKPTYKENTGLKKDRSKTKRESTKTVDGVAHQTTVGHSARKLEKWYYNCGDNDFIYVLEFENNILQKEDTAGRGKGKSDCKGK